MKTISTLPANLPDIPDARLPATYETAKRALASCVTADEAWTWQDKAAALAAYGRMARDRELVDFALRVQANAIHRAGELLRQVPRGDEATRYGRDGTVPPVTRAQAAADAGLSERQRKTALRVASIPRSEFDALVESDSPPTMTELAMRGTVRRPRRQFPARIPAGPAEIAEATALLRDLAAFCVTHDPANIARAPQADADVLRTYLGALRGWLDRFEANLPVEETA